MEMTRRWLVFVFMQIVNACLIASLSFKQLVPPDSKSFALVSIAMAGLGIAIGLFKSPLTGAASQDSATASEKGKQAGRVTISLALFMLLCAGIFASALALAGCATTQGQAASGVWKTCELGQLPNEGQAVLVGVDDALGQTDYSSVLENLGVSLGIQQVTCAVQALEAYYASAITPAPAAGQMAPNVKLVRAQTWLATHKAK